MTTSPAIVNRRLGRSDIELTPLGIGCWAIGGPTVGEDGRTIGWGRVDDEESVRGIRRSFDLGIRFFDTADVYGAGHSERLVARALAGHRHEAVIATKFGHTFDDDGSRRGHTMDVSRPYVRGACQASLRRLETDVIDLYQLHVGSLPDDRADAVVEELEALRREGLIRQFGWSCDIAAQARRWAERGTCASLQFIWNVLQETPGMAHLCETYSMTAIIRSPLASGFLSGKYGPDSRLPRDDWRAQAIELGWGDLFNPDGSANPAWLARLDALRDALTDGGRTLVQGALGWLWAKSPVTVPIPGFKTVAQVEENVGAIRFGPLAPEQMARIDAVIGSTG
ncbi:MAG TPA: aldo/keto reductase [Candidatus Binatia bacterium]|nr:aldo/keto reductase [Candidatus Binatia bacterium]